MINNEDTPQGDINVWISFADLFAGLLLIVIIGIGALWKPQIEQKKEDVLFSDNLIREMNKATAINKQMKDKLRKRLPEMGDSETEIVIPAEALYASGGYDVTDPSKQTTLKTIRQALREALDQAGEDRKFLRIIIEGHTDSDPIKSSTATKEIPTNWELSSRRATGVLRFFEEGGLIASDYNIVAMGLADTVPVATGNTENDKRRNRRIVIRIEPDLDKIRASLYPQVQK